MGSTATRLALTAASLLATSLQGAAAASPQGFLTPPVAPPENAVTAEKAILGKMLFWDEQLSSDGSISCGTCHIPSAGGTDPRIGPEAIHPGLDGLIGTGDDVIGSPGVIAGGVFGHLAPSAAFGLDPQVTSRRAPSTLTAAYFDTLFWDGRVADEFVDPLTGAIVIPAGGALETQSLGPLQSEIEMADEARDWASIEARLIGVRPLALASNLPTDVALALAADPTYPALFAAAFGTPEIDPVRIAFALATYQRSLVPDQSRFDDFMRGTLPSLTAAEERGLLAFDGSATCTNCHTPPLFTNGQFHALALRPSSEDLGHFLVTGNNFDRGRFKTPSLRNVALRDRFFHTGAPTITTLRDAVTFYNVGGAFDNLDPAIPGISLSPPEIADIVAFLETLTDPRVAAETYPFDRPTLRSERSIPNPLPLGTGGIAGTGGRVPVMVVAAAPAIGLDRFRVGLGNARSGSVAMLRLRLVHLGGLGGAGGAPLLRSLLPTPVVPVNGSGAGGGYGTWVFPLTASVSLVGLTLDGQWWLRDPAAPGFVSKSEFVRFTVE